MMDLGVVGGGSGRSRITPAPAPPTAQDPMPATNKILDGVADAENQKKKKRTLEDLMGELACLCPCSCPPRLAT